MWYKDSVRFGATVVLGAVILLVGCASPQAELPKAMAETQKASYISDSPSIYAENPAEENMAGMLQEATAGAMVRIQIGDVTGSGVIWDAIGDTLVIATAAHIFVEGNGVVEVTFADGWTARIVGYDMADTDLAFFYVDISKIPSEQLEQYYLVRRDTEVAGKLENGDGIILMGSCNEVAGNAYEGTVLEPWIYVEDFAQYMIWVDAEAEPGMSGGGLFDYEGNFLGILCGTNSDGETVALPLSVIDAVYQVI